MLSPKDYYKDTSLVNLPNEIWKRISNKLFYNRYAVSNLGRVQRIRQVIVCKPDRISTEGRIRHLSPKIIKPYRKPNGYLMVELHYGGHRIYKHLYVHRLVLSAFKPIEYNKYPQVNHINEVKTDNRASNLEGCTAVYNSNYGNHSKEISNSNATHNIIVGNLFIRKLFPTSTEAAKWLRNHIDTNPKITALRSDIVRSANMNNSHSHITHGYYCYLYKDYKKIMNKIHRSN